MTSVIPRGTKVYFEGELYEIAGYFGVCDDEYRIRRVSDSKETFAHSTELRVASGLELLGEQAE